MWSSWQGRRLHPDHAYGGYSLLSMWSGYIVHLVYYTTAAFNSDAAYIGLGRIVAVYYGSSTLYQIH